MGSPRARPAESDERRRAVFVDRDGTINRNPPPGEFVRRPADLRLLPGAAEGLRRLHEAGFLLVAFSNQSGISKGTLRPEELAAVNEHLGELLASRGVGLDGVYVCPHGADDDCGCRKPRPGRSPCEGALRVARSMQDDAEVQ